MQFLKFIGGFVLLFSFGSAFIFLKNPVNITKAKQLKQHIPSIEQVFAINPEEPNLDTALYSNVKNHFESQREIWSRGNKLTVASDSISYILGDSLAPYWIGTPWDFNGVSKKPQCGNIACGYFVYGLLEDAGFNLARIKLSQATSESSIKSLVNESNIKRFSNKDINYFLESMSSWGDGIYLVGLDYHIAILQVKGDDIQMIHSSVYPPVSVVIEDAATSLALNNSAYRIVGKLNNETTMRKWLDKSYFSLK